MSEYLVFYEDDEPGDDDIVIDVHAAGRQAAAQLDLETDLAVVVSNEGSPMGRWGMWISTLGFVLGVIGWIVFMTAYPDNWFENGKPSADNALFVTAVLFVFGALALILGAVLTILGRSISIKGELQELHVVQRDPHKHLR